jgi:Zn-dependent protease
MSDLINLIIYAAPATIITMTLHEFAHSFVSYKLGDNTPKETGRLSLNPLKHIDLLGALCLAIFHFGWAKPVQVNPNAYKNPKQGMALTALAGPLMNFIITFLAMFGMGIIAKTGNYYTTGAIGNYLYILFYYIAILSTGLGIFNLIPFPPLDGSKIIGAILPERIYFGYMKYERYGMIVLFILLFLNVLDTPLEWLNDTIINAMFSIVQFLLQL